MLEKGRINTIHVEFIMIPTIVATGLLSIPSIDAKLAGNSMWMTPLLGSTVGFLTVYIVWKLNQLYPRLTPIQYSEKIIGKIAGRLFGLLLVLFFIHNSGIVIKQYSEFIKTNVMLQTPRIVLSISILFVAALAVRGGLEVIARTAVICTTLFLSTSVVLLLLIKDIDLGNFLPFLEEGITPVLKGTLIHNSWFSEFFILAFIFPFLHKPKNGLKSGFKSVFIVMLILFYVNFFVLTTIGTSAEDLFYPVYLMIESISLIEFFENFEVIVTASWVLGNFVKLSVFLFVSSLALAELFKLTNYKVIVFPLSLFTLFFSFWDLPNLVVLENYVTHVQSYYLIIVQTAIPLLLLIIAIIKNRRSERT